ncbi:MULTISPECIES: FMN-binding negative transcriptional regulator [Myxococcus]|uniref:FMN-binding negative transcriptional regulator n=1 Tax=Myxococcus llanfairpwllgwyngyllgogerychwyrndrobwllllantysiliogogogochensis TaxID=2590453 RepID=A0A540X4Z3_9BACT|nr:MULTISPECIES: FMN-binding negative transcriptional regulator [Myxococcus]NTX05602.1 FMN-binding negative transcriptional regulator [Myxococcus sp. CA040A]NTX10228.1 FMN-binding negative transcriptional regulator [Myxococcus sp. CA056]NTX52869.1 FMN-binding negative transcriptional regulator [Myxococcus sp. CA039A]TQF16300.1 FMN-binding negative transcriptional regulator [Myxococcus llanfairpwllgwyngyllgogerychwyrndrobwllllantysiliogogogochensis]
MYIPRHFEERDAQRLLELMTRHSFATLVTVGEDGAPFATHLPFLTERDEAGALRLLAHMALPNPQWRAFAAERDALVIFQGPHAYVSPTWYATTPQVPTWNYATVHAYGRPKVIDAGDEVLRILRETAARYESGNERPWTLEQSEEYVNRLVGGIVAFELRVTRLEGKFKLSQNKGEADRKAVIAALERSPFAGDAELAVLMRAREDAG